MTQHALTALLAFAACQTPNPDPRCSRENCRLMNSSCHVGLELDSDPTCFVYQGDAGTDELRDRLMEYCVDACNGTHSGKLVECFAKAAAACEADPNLLPECQRDREWPEPSCEQRCMTQKQACDARCSGGETCKTCLYAGQADCTAQCPGRDRLSCIDCSEACLPAYFACADACPRQK